MVLHYKHAASLIRKIQVKIMLTSEKAEFFEMLDFYLSYWQRWPTCCCNSGVLRSRDQDGIRHARAGWGELQCSCLENPRDGGAWWAAVYGVAQSRTRLKWLSKKKALMNIYPWPCRLLAPWEEVWLEQGSPLKQSTQVRVLRCPGIRKQPGVKGQKVPGERQLFKTDGQGDCETFYITLTFRFLYHGHAPVFNIVIVSDHELLMKFMEKPNLLCTRFANDLFLVHHYLYLQNASTCFVSNDLFLVLESFFRNF